MQLLIAHATQQPGYVLTTTCSARYTTPAPLYHGNRPTNQPTHSKGYSLPRGDSNCYCTIAHSSSNSDRSSQHYCTAAPHSTIQKRQLAGLRCCCTAYLRTLARQALCTSSTLPYHTHQYQQSASGAATAKHTSSTPSDNVTTLACSHADGLQDKTHSRHSNATAVAQGQCRADARMRGVCRLTCMDLSPTLVPCSAWMERIAEACSAKLTKPTPRH